MKKITCKLNEGINKNCKNFKRPLLTDAAMFHPFRSFGSRLSDTDGPPLQHSGPPRRRCRLGTYVRERGSTVHRCHNLCGARPIKGGWTASPINRSLFSSSPLFLDPPAAGSHSCQDRTQRCSLPVESIIVKQWRGITSAGGYKSDLDAMECHHQETSFPINF